MSTTPAPKRKRGRPRRYGAPMSITVTPETLAWLTALRRDGDDTVTAVVRRLIDKAREDEDKKAG